MDASKTRTSATETWDRVREALRRDWEETKFHLSMPGGHELNQNISDTVGQMWGSAPLPEGDRPNPPREMATWEEAERAIRFGFEGAGRHGATQPRWTPTLEVLLAREWLATGDARAWADVRGFVRHGYESPHAGLGPSRPA